MYNHNRCHRQQQGISLETMISNAEREMAVMMAVMMAAMAGLRLLLQET
jgi:hypothetical protein